MLLHSKRPKMRRTGYVILKKGESDILHIGPIPPLGTPRNPGLALDDRDEDKQTKQGPVIYRENSQGSTDVEISQTMWMIFRVEENSRNQKAGQDKEKIRSEE